MPNTINLSNQKVLMTGDYYLAIDPNIAEDIGRSAAFVLQKLHAWIVSENKYGKQHEGRRWIHNSYDKWQKEIKIYSAITIKRAFDKLKKMNLVATKKLNQMNYDNTLSFTILYENLEKYCLLKKISSATQKAKTNTKETNKNIKIQHKAAAEIVSKETEVKVAKVDHTVGQSMFEIWSDVVLVKLQDKQLLKTVTLTEKRSVYLKKALTQFFAGNLEGWKAFCESIASNDFLMGGGSKGFFADLDWTLRFSSIEKILEGYYSPKTFESKKVMSQEPVQMLEVSIPETLPQAEQELRHQFKTMLGDGKYISWLQNAEIVEEGDKLTLVVANAFIKTRFSSDPQLMRVAEHFASIEVREVAPTELDNSQPAAEVATAVVPVQNVFSLHTNESSLEDVTASVSIDVAEDIAAMHAAGEGLPADITPLADDLLQTRHVIAMRVGFANYKSWFKTSRLLRTENGYTLQVGSEFVKTTLCQRFEAVLQLFKDVLVVRPKPIPLRARVVVEGLGYNERLAA